MSENLKLDQYKQISLKDINKIFKKKSKNYSSYKRLSKIYSLRKRPLELRDFRTSPYVFDKIKLNWIVASKINKKSKANTLAGHAITCEINWSKTTSDLPKDGWSGTTLRCYENSNSKNPKKINTLVGLFIHIDKNYKKKQLSKIFIEEMKKLAIKKRYNLIIPLRPPTRFEKKYCKMPFKEFVKMKRKDGFFEDYWLRQHQRFGAKFIGLSTTSHQHKMSIEIFNKFFGKHNFIKTGYYTVNILGGWYKIFFNLKNNTIIINQGCVWVSHKTV